MSNKKRIVIATGFFSIFFLTTLVFFSPLSHAFGSTAPSSEYRTLWGLNSRLVIWFVAQLHLMFAAFVLGVPFFAVIIEYVGYKTTDEKYDKVAKEFMGLCLTAYSITALFGGALLFALVGLYPAFFSYLTSVFNPLMGFYALLLFGESILLYLYYYSWESLQKRKRIHIALGVLLNLVGVVLMFSANAWATFMMSPGGVDPSTGRLLNLWDAINSYTWMPVNIHRLIANVAFGGAIVSAYAAVRFLHTSQVAEKKYYDWMGHTGAFVAISALIPLPFAGYWLGKEIYDYDQSMGVRMMGDLFSWLFIIQAGMIGTLFLAANYYLWSGMGRIQGGAQYRKYRAIIIGLLILCFAVWMTPHTLFGMKKTISSHHPVVGGLGLMSAKNTAVNIIILLTFLTFLLYSKAGKTAIPETARKGNAVQAVVFVVAFIVVITLGIMGYIPEYSGEIRINIFTPTQVTVVLVALFVMTVTDLIVYSGLSAKREVDWGNMTDRSQYALILIAATFTSLMGLMGYARSGIRENWHVYGIMKDTSRDAFTPTIGYAMNFISFIVLVFVLLVFTIFLIRSLDKK